MRDGQKQEFARRLRKTMMDVEHALWWRLRKRQIAGCRFRRQHPVGPFIADFACIGKRLVVEVDGGQHDGCEAGALRDRYLRMQGWSILRFWNNEVMENMEGVCDVILRHLADTHPHPGLPPLAGEGDKQCSYSLPRAAGEGWGGGPAFLPDASAATHLHPGLPPRAGEGHKP